MFRAPHEHLQALLRALDLLLHREILRLRARYQLSLDEFRGLYVSDAHVDALVADQAGQTDTPETEFLTSEARRIWDECRDRLHPHFPWAHMLCEFELDDFEAFIVLMALAPHMLGKYETLYSYLNDDVSRKAPAVELACRVLASVPQEKLEVRRRLQPGRKLFRERLIVPASETRAGAVPTDFTISPDLAAFLLELDGPAEIPETSWADLRLPQDLEAALHSLAPDGPLVVLETGDTSLGKDIAAAACAEWGMPLVTIDANNEAVQQALEQAAFRARLRKPGVLLAGMERLLRPADPASKDDLHRIASVLERTRGPRFLHIAPGEVWRNTPLGSVRHVSLTIPEPDFETRRELWREAMLELGERIEQEAATEAAARFRLPASRIRAAARYAADMRDLEQPGGPVGPKRLFAAAREFSGNGLAALARKAKLVNTWDDLVLPAATLAQLEEVAAAARHRETVYSTWGLGRRHPGAGGIKVLFSGQSGTGKTMSAGVIARELGLDLYQIDLSRIVSKYIGETEKNLDQVFRAARGSNAVLFFDEADALFGKRSEVKDAHDRYANIEVGYLLQKMEEYDGIAVLATNLGRNIDAAFSRRLQYVVEFPLPDERLRLRLWKAMFPPEAPLAGDVNFALLARQYRLSGGEIRNVALAAAFLAAGDGQVITMQLILRAVAREMVRQGRIAPGAEPQPHRRTTTRMQHQGSQ